MYWRRLRPRPSPSNPAYEIGRCKGRSIGKGSIVLDSSNLSKISETLLGNRAMAHSALDFYQEAVGRVLFCALFQVQNSNEFANCVWVINNTMPTADD